MHGATIKIQINIFVKWAKYLHFFYDFLKIFIHIDTLKNKYSLFKI